MENTTCEECFICQQNYNENNRNITITENHKFHASCLHHWLSIGRDCPCCREILIQSNIQATNIEDLRIQILREQRTQQERRRQQKRLRDANELQPKLRRVNIYTYWDNFEEYCNYYNKRKSKNICRK